LEKPYTNSVALTSPFPVFQVSAYPLYRVDEWKLEMGFIWSQA